MASGHNPPQKQMAITHVANSWLVLPIHLAMDGNVPAIKLLLDREWPAANRHEIAGAEGGALQVQEEAAARELDRLLAPAASLPR